MANRTLRELAKEHALGNLDKDTYRKSRAELIQGILSATIPLQEIDYPPLVQPPEPEELDDTQRKDDPKRPPAPKAEAEAATAPKSETPNVSNNAATLDSGGSNKMLFIGLGIAVVALILLLVFAMGGNSDKQTNTATPASIDISENTISTQQTATQAQNLIQSFLSKKNWSASSLDDFMQQWAELPAGDILASKGSLALGQLTNAIYKQLLEEQALSGLVDDDSSLNKQRQLVQFASELGIDDPRISLPEEAQLVEEVMENLQP
jgi:hypothetical protein